MLKLGHLELGSPWFLSLLYGNFQPFFNIGHFLILRSSSTFIKKSSKVDFLDVRQKRTEEILGKLLVRFWKSAARTSLFSPMAFRFFLKLGRVYLASFLFSKLFSKIFSKKLEEFNQIIQHFDKFFKI